MTRKNEHGYDDYLVVMRSTRLYECHKRGSIVAGGSPFGPLSRNAAEAIRRDMLANPNMRDFNVWVIHKLDY